MVRSSTLRLRLRRGVTSDGGELEVETGTGTGAGSGLVPGTAVASGAGIGAGTAARAEDGIGDTIGATIGATVDATTDARTGAGIGVGARAKNEPVAGVPRIDTYFLGVTSGGGRCGCINPISDGGEDQASTASLGAGGGE